MSFNKTAFVIVGPTASGKTSLSIEVAKILGVEIVSADSRQIYKGLEIGSAYPSKDELAAVPHHFIGHTEVADAYTSGRYGDESRDLAAKLFKKNDAIVLVGGSGLYIDAFCDGLDDIPSDPRVRDELNKELDEEGLQNLVDELRRLDPDYYAVVDLCNPRRIVRALEVCRTTGRTYSSLRVGKDKQRNFNVVKIGLCPDRDDLYEKIDKRTDGMISDGLEQEVRKMIPFRNLSSLQTVGYREFFDYFDGKVSFEETVNLIKRNTRRYAKRQMTWFRRDEEINWFDPLEKDKIITFITRSLGK